MSAAARSNVSPKAASSASAVIRRALSKRFVWMMPMSCSFLLAAADSAATHLFTLRQPGSRDAVEKVHDADLAAPRLRVVAADDLVGSVVRALDDHIRLD